MWTEILNFISIVIVIFRHFKGNRDCDFTRHSLHYNLPVSDALATNPLIGG